MHLADLHAAVETILLGTVIDQLQALLCQTVVLLRTEIFLTSNQLVGIQCTLRLCGAACAFHLHCQLQTLLLQTEFLLLHRDESVAQKVLFLSEFGFGVEDLQVEVVVAEYQYAVACLDMRTLFHDDLLHDTAFEWRELDSGHGLHLSIETNVVVELAFCDSGDGQSFGVDTHSAIAATSKENNEQYSHC